MFVTLFNLQGAHRFAAVGVHFTTPFWLCQELFQVFQNFFSSQPARRAAPLFHAALAGDSYRLPHLVSFVKNFFQVFQTFLFQTQERSVVFLCISRRFLPSRKALAYDIRERPSCQQFFSIFSIFFLGSQTATISAAFLLFYYTISAPIPIHFSFL